MHFDILNRLGVDHQCDRRTDGQMLAIARSYPLALKRKGEIQSASGTHGSDTHRCGSHLYFTVFLLHPVVFYGIKL